MIEKGRFIFYAALVSCIILEISFMSVPGTGIEGGTAGNLAYIKFSMYTFSFCIIMFCLSKIQKQEIRFKKSFFWVIIYILISIISLIVFSVKKNNFDLVAWARLIGLFFLVPYLFVLSHIEARRILLISFISKIIPIAMIAIIYFISRDSVMRQIWIDGSLDIPRLGGGVIPPNTLGAMLGSIIIMLITYFPEFKRFKFSIISICGVMLYATQSRTAMASVFISLVIGYILAHRSYKSLRIVIFISVIGWVGYLLVHDLMSTVQVSSRLSVGLGTFGGRLQLWGQGLSQLISEDVVSILFGCGYMLPGSWYYVGTLRTNSLHNGYLQVLIGTGMLGFLSYIMVWVTLLSRKYRECCNIDYCFYSLLCFLIIFNITELGGFVLVNSMTLTILVLIGLSGNNSDINA